MDNSKKTSFDDRLSAAANAKKAELEKFRARSWAKIRPSRNDRPPDDVVSVARDARIAERNASRLAGLAREAVRGGKPRDCRRDAAAEAEEAARAAEVAKQAADEVALQTERKAARDARYAARKARSRRR